MEAPMRKTRAREVATMLKAIHAQEGCKEALRKADGVTASLKAMRLDKAAETLSNVSRTP